MIPLLLALACAPAEVDPSDGTTEGGTTPTGDGGSQATEAEDRWPTPVLTASAPVLDPTLDGEVETVFLVELSDQAAGASCEVELELHHDAGVLALGTVAPGDSLAWDGTDGGQPLPPGLVRLDAWSSCDDGSRGSASLDLAIVRLAPAELDLGAAEPADEQPVAFHKRSLVHDGPQVIDLPEYRLAEGLLDDAAPTVAPWADPDQAPWEDDPDAVARNVPAALVAGATPVLDFVPAASTVGGAATVPDGVQVTLATPSPGDWQEGSLALAPLAGTLGRSDLALTWTWEACLGTDCSPVAVPGSRTTTHTVYRLAGPSQLRDGSAEGFADGTPWLGTLADTVEAVEGIDAADPHAVMDALRDRIYTDPWLIYDPSTSDYSDYEGSYIYWEFITSELSDWLDRRQGLRLYCHSVSCLLSVLADHWGIEAEQIVLGVGFNTNLTHAAGTDSWVRWYFNSHSVATLYDQALVWDAAVELDGDDDPYNSPVTPLAPKGMPLEDYLDNLTANNIGIVNSGRCYYR